MVNANNLEQPPPNDSGDFVCEVRLEPNPLFVDGRGVIAARLHERTNWKNWEIKQLEVQVVNPKKERYVVSPTKAAYVCHYLPATEAAVQTSGRLLEYLSTLPPFPGGGEFPVSRIGTRFRLFRATDLSFEEIRERMHERIAKMGDPVRSLLGTDCQLDDIAHCFIFQFGSRKMQVTVTPMAEKDLKLNFQFMGGFPPRAIFVDVDTYHAAKQMIRVPEIRREIGELSHKGRKVAEGLLNLFD